MPVPPLHLGNSSLFAVSLSVAPLCSISMHSPSLFLSLFRSPYQSSSSSLFFLILFCLSLSLYISLYRLWVELAGARSFLLRAHEIHSFGRELGAHGSSQLSPKRESPNSTFHFNLGQQTTGLGRRTLAISWWSDFIWLRYLGLLQA